jgi:probable phosphoglycerate mutase
MTTRVILVRHGQSTYNALGLYQGSSDIPQLTTFGYRQAKKTAELLKSVSLSAIYASPLQRVQKTACIILSSLLNPPENVQTCAELTELDLPQWQGLAFEYVRENFPDEYRCWKQKPQEFSMITSPTITGNKGNLAVISNNRVFPALELYQRVHTFWQKVLQRQQDQTFLIVSHGGTNRALINTALGINADCYHRLQQSNCGVNILEFADNSLESGQLIATNLTHHLGENLANYSEQQGLRLLLIPSNFDSNPASYGHLLENVNIDFSLTEDVANCQNISQAILKSHPNTVNLQVLHDYFPQLWQKTIDRNFTTSGKSVTGLVIARPEMIQQIIGQVLGMSSNYVSRIRLIPNTISSVHYSGDNHPPVLQTLNFNSAINL